jgi:hypothetical protein
MWGWSSHYTPVWNRQTYNAPWVRFSAALGEEPEIELALV